VKTYDNSGKQLLGEITHFRTSGGDSVTTNTSYYNGRVVSQTVSVAQTNGKVSTITTLGGKLLP
jgi:hypothetical protein